MKVIIIEAYINLISILFSKFDPSIPNILRDHPPSFILILSHPLMCLDLIKGHSFVWLSM